MKTLLIILALAYTANAATLIGELVSPKITSTVTFEDGAYHYDYVINSKPIDGKHDISHVTIELGLCGEADIFGFYADDESKLEHGEGYIKFDDIKPDGDTYRFGFYSRSAPNISSATLKAATLTHSDNVFAPKCVPEPSALILSSIGFLLIFNRKRA